MGMERVKGVSGTSLSGYQFVFQRKCFPPFSKCVTLCVTLLQWALGRLEVRLSVANRLLYGIHTVFNLIKLFSHVLQVNFDPTNSIR